MTLKILPVAEAEADRAAVELESARPGIGFDFTRAYDQALINIAADPERYPLAEDSPEKTAARYVYLARFRYRIVYAVLADEVLVVAVAHTSRQPEYWHARLTTSPPEAT